MPREQSPRPGANGLFAKRWPDNGCAWNASRGSCWSAIDTCTFGKSIYKAEPHTLLWWRAAPPPERAAPVALRAPSAALSGPQNRNKGKTQSVKDVLATPVSHVLATYTSARPASAASAPRLEDRASASTHGHTHLSSPQLLSSICPQLVLSLL